MLDESVDEFLCLKILSIISLLFLGSVKLRYSDTYAAAKLTLL